MEYGFHLWTIHIHFTLDGIAFKFEIVESFFFTIFYLISDLTFLFSNNNNLATKVNLNTKVPMNYSTDLQKPMKTRVNCIQN